MKKKKKILDSSSTPQPNELPAKKTKSSTTNQKVCSECKCTKAKYRPLVNSFGDFLCDKCYKELFPATFMCDEDAGGMRSKRKEDKKRSLIYEEFPEEEECRICLDHGIHRWCCQNYFCDKCYYNEAMICPGCNIGVKVPEEEEVSCFRSNASTILVIIFGVAVACSAIVITVAMILSSRR